MAEKTTAAPWELPYPTSAGEVKLGAEDFKELAERLTTILKEKILIFKTSGAPLTAKSGELIESTASITITLPPGATANQPIGAYAGTGTVKLTTSGGNTIYGDFISAAATITLTTGQHVIVQSKPDGNWLIIAGEPKREQVYETKTYTKAEWEAGVVISATRDALVGTRKGPNTFPSVGGVAVTSATGVQVRVPAGQTIKSTATEAVEAVVLLL